MRLFSILLGNPFTQRWAWSLALVLLTFGVGYAQTDDFDPDFAEQLSFKQGKPAPNFTLEDAQGKKVSLASFRGKVVYLHFWAEWCGVCVGELPELNKLSTRLAKEGAEVVVLNVCTASEKPAWKEALSKHKVAGINLIDPSGDSDPKRVSTLFGFDILPSYVIISKEGNIIGYDVPSPDEDIMTDWMLLQATKGVVARKSYELYAKNTPEFLTWMKAYLKKYGE
ncbi:MAG: TlpA disulfide reductase family protein [Spirosomataceae bacterium]